MGEVFFGESSSGAFVVKNSPIDPPAYRLSGHFPRFRGKG
jgi:hypothetical protein